MGINYKNFFIVFTVLIFFILDRLTKYIFYFHLIKKKYFFITPLKNKGIAFGLLIPKRFNLIFYILIILIIFVLMILLIKSFQKKDYLKIFSLLLFLIGAMSNIIDRLKYGFVLDFIDLRIWPVFNIADLMIVGGFLVLLIQYFYIWKFKQK